MKDPLFSSEHPVRSGTGYVHIHWHYEGCMIDIIDEATDKRLTVIPSLGDDAIVIGRPCLAELERSAS